MPKIPTVTFIGFGEAGPVFAEALKKAGCDVSSYDILYDDVLTFEQQWNKAKKLGVNPHLTLTEAINGADIIISTVTASNAFDAATAVAKVGKKGQMFIDLNSVSPETKLSIGKLLNDKGMNFTEAVAMDTVPALGHRVPILMCGPHAEKLSKEFADLGLNVRNIGEQLGLASSIKLFRSIFIKGLEALFSESIEAAGKLGLHEYVIDSIQSTFPGINWSYEIGYCLSRASLHAERRAAEMRQCSSMLESMQIEPIMAKAITKKHQQIADRKLNQIHIHGIEVIDFIKATQKGINS